jgi:hypothetical protein
MDLKEIGCGGLDWMDLAVRMTLDSAHHVTLGSVC